MSEAAPKEWRGRFFEDFEVGDVYTSRLGRTVTEADNVWFTCLTSGPTPPASRRRPLGATPSGS